MGNVRIRTHMPESEIITDRLEAIIANPAELHRFITQAEHTIRVTGALPAGPLWGYLEYRHDLDPERFDLHHRYFDAIWRKLDHGTMPVVVPPAPPAVPPVVATQTPEPAGLALGAVAVVVMLGVWLWSRLRYRVNDEEGG